MKKVCRFVSLFLLSSLMIILANTILVSLPAAARGQPTWPALAKARFEPIITAQNSLNIQAIDSLTITYNPPALANFPIRFTASITAGGPPPGALHSSALAIVYIWSFGDNSDPSPGSNATVVHTYTTPATYTVVVTAVDIADTDVATQAISVAVGRPEQRFLPTVFKNFTFPVLPADLICTLTIDPPNPAPGEPVLVSVQLKNQGEGQADGFWVDLYINPTTPPTPGRANRIRWQDACGGPSSCPRGIAWSISDSPLGGGISRTLVSIPNIFNPTEGQGFEPANSSWASGVLPSGSYRFYAYVDSINGVVETIDGAVKEKFETNNRCQRNLVVPAAVQVDRPEPSALPKRSTSP